MVSWLRAGWTLTAAASVTAGVVFLWALRYPFLRRRWDARLRWRDFILTSWARSLLRVLRVRVIQQGSPPRGGGLLISNHLSYIDILLLGASQGGSFVAKSEIESWPIFGRLCHVGEVIFVRRNVKRDIPHVIEEIRRRLDVGSRILLFPEGTSTDGESVAPFRASLLAPAAAGEIPVHWAAVYYRTREGDPQASEAVCWWGGMEFGGHLLRLAGLRGFDAWIRYGDEPIVDTDRKRLAGRLESAVGAALEGLQRSAKTQSE